MRCYGNHPLTLPILFTKGDSRDTQTIHMEIGSNGQTAPDTCSALDTDFSNITSHSILRQVRAAEIVEKLTATPTVSPAWRQISIGWRQEGNFLRNQLKECAQRRTGQNILLLCALMLSKNCVFSNSIEKRKVFLV